ncbi:MAG: TonB-dependent siderophore receptor [Rhodospirillales bacterium]|nr:TonB-dependent siderophore receptor [Rhodospirillales bacterium]
MAVAGGAHAQSAAPAGDAVQIPPVSVEGVQGTGYQATTPHLSKLTEPLLDTPQSITVVPRQLIDDQNDITVRDALRNVPGISLAAGEGGAQGDSLTIRGFSARNDFFLDGMRDFGSYTRDPFNLESIEVLKGPAAVIFGRGSTGGVVNQVSKEARLAPVTAGTVTFGTDGTKRFTADVDRPIEGLDGAALRLNVMGNLNGVIGRDQAEYRRFGVAPSLAFGLGSPTRVVINYLHQQEYDTPDYGLPWLYGRPAATSRASWYGFADSDYLQTIVDIGTIRVEHDVNDSLMLRSQFRYGNYERSVRVTEPQVNYNGITVATSLAAISVNRNMISAQSTETFLQNQTDATWRFSTGPLEHALVAGWEVGKETSSPNRFAYSNVPTTNLLFPVQVPFTAPSRLTTAARTTSNTAALTALDTVKLGEFWEIIGGVRWDNFDTSYYQNIQPTSYFHRTDSVVSGRAGLVFKPAPNGSLYFAWGTSFNPSAESLSLASSTADLAPEQNETYEVGTKWDVLDRKLSLTGALFQITKNNARVPDPNNPLFNILGGKQQVRGFELGVAGHLTEAWEIFAGYAYLASQVLSSTQQASVGEPLANVPRHTLNIWSTYVLPWYDIQVGGGMNYVSSRWASSTPNTASGRYNIAPGYVTFQAMAKMPVRPGLSLQVNATNLADVKYYDLLHPGHVVPGSGRTFLFSASFAL